MDGMGVLQVAGTDEGILSLYGCHCTVEASVFIKSIDELMAEATTDIWDTQCASALIHRSLHLITSSSRVTTVRQHIKEPPISSHAKPTE